MIRCNWPLIDRAALRSFIVPGVGRERPDGGTRLGHLHGNRGNQNYPVPAQIAPTRPLTVLIWCRAFAVPVAAATLR
jgi:hypothetical protein